MGPSRPGDGPRLGRFLPIPVAGGRWLPGPIYQIRRPSVARPRRCLLGAGAALRPGEGSSRPAPRRPSATPCRERPGRRSDGFPGRLAPPARLESRNRSQRRSRRRMDAPPWPPAADVPDVVAARPARDNRPHYRASGPARTRIFPPGAPTMGPVGGSAGAGRRRQDHARGGDRGRLRSAGPDRLHGLMGHAGP